MDQREVERLRQELEYRRHEAAQSLSRLGRETRSLDDDSPQDSADQSVSSLSRESLFEQSSQRRTTLRLIDVALHRIADGSFGVCVGCGDDIKTRRLRAVPWTQFCLRCQEVLEQEAAAGSSLPTSMPVSMSLRRAG